MKPKLRMVLLGCASISIWAFAVAAVCALVAGSPMLKDQLTKAALLSGLSTPAFIAAGYHLEEDEP